MYCNATKNFALNFRRLTNQVPIDKLIFDRISVSHYHFHNQVSSLSSLLIYDSKGTWNVSFYENFSQRNADTTDVITHTTNCHINWLVNQIYSQNLSLHVLQELWWCFYLKLLGTFKKGISSLCCCRPNLKCVKVIAEERKHSFGAKTIASSLYL